MDNIEALYNILVEPGEVGTSTDESRPGTLSTVSRNLLYPIMIRKQQFKFQQEVLKLLLKILEDVYLAQVSNLHELK